MAQCTQQERDQGAHVPAHVRSARPVHVPPEEMVHRDVPFPAELEPVA